MWASRSWQSRGRVGRVFGSETPLEKRYSTVRPDSPENSECSNHGEAHDGGGISRSNAARMRP